jgi:hypothetical protein
MDLNDAIVSKLTGKDVSKLQQYSDYSLQESEMKIEKTKSILRQNLGTNYLNILMYVSITLLIFIILVMIF